MCVPLALGVTTGGPTTGGPLPWLLLPSRLEENFFGVLDLATSLGSSKNEVVRAIQSQLLSK